MPKNTIRFACVALMASLGLGGCVIKVKKRKPPAPPTVKPMPKPKKKAKRKRKRRGFAGVKFTWKVTEDGHVELPGPVVFETNSATLKEESNAVLDLVKNYLEVSPNVTKLRIEGHTSTKGSDTHNQELSEARAAAVSKWLVESGIDCQRLVPTGFGETKPVITPEETEEDRARNRRVAFVNAELDGAALDGLPVDGGGKLAGDPCE